MIGARRALQTRRQTATQTLMWCGRRFAVSFGKFPDGKPAEVFISGTKPASDITAMACDAALIFSLALQYGCPLEVIASAIGREEDGTPQSIIGVAADAFQKEIGG